MPDVIRHRLRCGAAFAVVTGLAACVSAPAPPQTYPFVGRWDCGVEVFTFTDQSYNNGSRTVPIRNVSRDGRNFTLLLAAGDVIALAAVTETGLTWVSGTTGDQLTCRRL